MAPRGFSFIEVLVSLFVIGTVIMLSSAILKAVPLSRHDTFEQLALSIANSKVETLRAGGYTALPSNGPFVDTLMTSLPSGSGTMVFSDYNTKTKQVVVSVLWREPASTATSSVSLTTLVTSTGGLP
jgi:prepilin-type N-terminal cleavage/methylation domain-containing protein